MMNRYENRVFDELEDAVSYANRNNLRIVGFSFQDVNVTRTVGNSKVRDKGQVWHFVFEREIAVIDLPPPPQPESLPKTREDDALVQTVVDAMQLGASLSSGKLPGLAREIYKFEWRLMARQVLEALERAKLASEQG